MRAFGAGALVHGGDELMLSADLTEDAAANGFEALASGVRDKS